MRGETSKWRSCSSLLQSIDRRGQLWASSKEKVSEALFPGPGRYIFQGRVGVEVAKARWLVCMSNPGEQQKETATWTKQEIQLMMGRQGMFLKASLP